MIRRREEARAPSQRITTAEQTRGVFVDLLLPLLTLINSSACQRELSEVLSRPRNSGWAANPQFSIFKETVSVRRRSVCGSRRTIYLDADTPPTSARRPSHAKALRSPTVSDAASCEEIPWRYQGLAPLRMAASGSPISELFSRKINRVTRTGSYWLAAQTMDPVRSCSPR